MASEQDNLDQLLSARMSKLAEHPLEDSIVDNVASRLIDQSLSEIDVRHSNIREWVLLSAGAIALIVVAAFLPEFTVPAEAPYLASLREGFEEMVHGASQLSVLGPYVWLILLLPAGLVFAFE